MYLYAISRTQSQINIKDSNSLKRTNHLIHFMFDLLRVTSVAFKKIFKVMHTVDGVFSCIILLIIFIIILLICYLYPEAKSIYIERKKQKELEKELLKLEKLRCSHRLKAREKHAEGIDIIKLRIYENTDNTRSLQEWIDANNCIVSNLEKEINESNLKIKQQEEEIELLSKKSNKLSQKLNENTELLKQKYIKLKNNE